MNEVLYFNLNKTKKLEDNIIYLLKNIPKYNLSLRNIWCDKIHYSQVELEGSSENLKNFYEFFYKTKVSNKDWKNILKYN